MRPRANALVHGILAVLLVLLQYGVVLHGFAHEHEAAAHETQASDLGLVQDGLCQVCLAYAAVGAAAPSVAPRPVVMDADSACPSRRAGFVAAAVALYPARAPPRLLV